MASRYIVRQNDLICIVSRLFSHFFPKYKPLWVHCIAGFLHGASPKTPVVPRTPSLLINRYWTGLATSCPGGSHARESAEFLTTAEEQNLVIGRGGDVFFP